MKKERSKGFISGVAASVLVFSLVGTAAATIGSRTLTANYNDIKIEVDGKQITPTDANGNTVEPFAIDGTTYLPVRAVGNALGIDVGWDGTTGTVQLTRDWSMNDAVLLMGLFKSLEDGFNSLKDHFSNLQSGDYKLLSGQSLVSGPYQGMSYYSATVARTQDELEIAEGHYQVCDAAGVLTQEDVQLMAEYRRLAGLVKQAYTVLDGDPTEMAIRNVTGAAIQNAVDAMTNELTAGARFWEAYRGA